MSWLANDKPWIGRISRLLVPKSHRGRIVLILLVGLLLTQGASYWAWYRQVSEGQLKLVDKVSKNAAFSVASTVKFFTSLPNQYRHMSLNQLRKMGGTRFYVSLNLEHIVIEPVTLDSQKELVVNNFESILKSELDYQELYVEFSAPETLHVHTNGTLLKEIPKRWSQRLLIEDLSPPILVIQLKISEQEWLYVATLLPVPDYLADMQLMSPQTLVYLAVFVVGILGLTFVVVRQQTRPLTFMLQAAEELGQDIGHNPIAERGSQEMRATAKVFNQMQARIQTYITTREHFFAAMSHDLKTPITRMRIRTELLENPKHKLKFEKDLDEVEHMVRGALQALRDTREDEDSLLFDLKRLVAEVCEDYPNSTSLVRVTGAVTEIEARPKLIKRAISNLLGNALFYGSHCDIVLSQNKNSVCVELRDYGPGIPSSEMENVLNPFVRLEPSRSRNTGGSGLGLGIARNIIHAHGGELILNNHCEQGLIVKILLPLKMQS